MAYEVLARKWRPQRFEDVVGQAPVVQTLTHAIQSGRTAHAYLFVGPRGIGKTSIARIFAKALNCVKGPTPTPCGTCDSCREIADGRNLDVMEIDGASNTGVDQVRDLRDTVKYVPTHGRFKIYLIDEVHMLSLAAFNALLKTLEEPPPHVKFLFATTEPDRIPATILSRCQRFDLRRIAMREIVERLELVAQTEKIDVDRDALLAIARGSEGSLRDAESALDQIVSFRGDRVREEDVLSVFGLVSRRTLESLAESVLRGDVKVLVETLAELDNAGKDLRRLTIELIDHFRNLLVYLHVPGPGPGRDLLEGQMEALRRQAAGTDPERVLRITKILSEAEERMRHTLSKRVLMDTTLIRCARAAAVPTVEEVLAKLERLGAREDPAVPAASPAAPVAAPPVPAPPPAPPAAPPAPPPAAPAAVPAGGDPAALLTAKWEEIVAKMTKLSIGSHRLLRDMRPLSVEGDRVIVGFDPEFAGDVQELHDHRDARLLTQLVCGALGRQVLIEFRPSPELAEHIRRARAARERPATADAYVAAAPAPEKSNSRKNWHKDPTVQKVKEILGGQILDVRE